ncbi:MAG: hypothetical protein AMS18_07075 [Gemmatimonas sp. SG8_17]|nr:MAG: hypothetical protein AMS18_07075 [Gemmatimonas sp. SG8_17]
MDHAAWISVIVAFLAIEGSLFAAWMNLRERVTRNEATVCKFREVMEARMDPLNELCKHLMEEGDGSREKIAANVARLDVHDQQHRSAEARLRRLEGGDVRRDPTTNP